MVGNFSNSVSGVKYERSRRVKKERARERGGEREREGHAPGMYRNNAQGASVDTGKLEGRQYDCMERYCCM